MTPSNDEQLNYLLERYVDETIDRQELAELEAMLKGSPEGMRRYIDFMSLHGDLQRALGPLPSIGQFPKGNLLLDASTDRSERTDRKSQFPGGIRWSMPKGSWPVVFIALNTLIAFVMIKGWYFGMTDSAPSLRETLTPINTTQSAVARITHRIDCNIEMNKWSGGFSDNLEPGTWLTVEQGLLVIEFLCGAEVTLEGPVEFEVIDGFTAYLRQGKLFGMTEHALPGFQIRTELVDIVKPALSFGVQVDAKGTVDVHVFSGQANVERTENRIATNMSTKTTAELSTSQALRFRPDDGQPMLMAASPRSFVTIPAATSFAPAESQLPWSLDNQPVLWLDAQRAVQVDENLRVVFWGDIKDTKTSYSRNQFWQVNAQRRPFYVNQETTGRKAIRFMGDEFLISEPMATTPSMTMFIVGQLHPQRLLRGQDAGIIDFGGYRNLQVFRDLKNRIVAQMSGRWERGALNPGSTLKTDVLDDQFFLVTYRYAPEDNQANLFLNSSLAAQGAATFKPGSSSNRIIGGLNQAFPGFVGDINEIIIFDNSVEDQVLQEINHWLMEKYTGNAPHPSHPHTTSDL